MYNDTNHLYLTFLQCVFSILLTDWTMARLIITGGCTMTLVTFIWLFSAMCFLFCSKQLTDWTKARKADHRTVDCPKWREELRRYIYGTYMLREKFILLIFVIWYFSFDICHLTNGPMDRWTDGPMDQWTNGHSLVTLLISIALILFKRVRVTLICTINCTYGLSENLKKWVGAGYIIDHYHYKSSCRSEQKVTIEILMHCNLS